MFIFEFPPNFVTSSYLTFISSKKVNNEYQDNYLLVEKTYLNKPCKLILSIDPSLNTDLGPLLTSFLLTNSKISIIEDRIYPLRNKYVEELKKIGANVEVINNKIVIFPNSKYISNRINGEDLRGCMSLIMSSILSQKRQLIHGIEYLERGYENIVDKLRYINVNIRRKDE